MTRRKPPKTIRESAEYQNIKALLKKHKPSDRDMILGDLLADLRYAADELGINFDASNSRSLSYYKNRV